MLSWGWNGSAHRRLSLILPADSFETVELHFQPPDLLVEGVLLGAGMLARSLSAGQDRRQPLRRLRFQLATRLGCTSKIFAISAVVPTPRIATTAAFAFRLGW
jgi:hypothetical protein